MRQRGAGTRDINLTFDLQLPGIPKISRSPLKPPKSGRSIKSTQPELLPLRATRQTPNTSKATLKLVYNRTPTTVKKTTHIVAEPGNATTHDVATFNAPGARNPVYDEEAPPSKKRKVGPTPTENNAETPDIPPVKKRRKRKSIGLHTHRKKANSPVRKITQPFKQRTQSEKADMVQAEPSELASAQLSEPTKDILDGTGAGEQSEKLLTQQVRNEPRSRKRKPIAQLQRLKKKPKLTDEADGPSQFVTNDDIQEPSANVENKPKPQKRTRAPIVQGPEESRKHLGGSHPLGDCTLKSSRNDSSLVHTISDIVVVDQPKKRGRKPRTAVNGKTTGTKAVVHPATTIAEIQAGIEAPQNDPQLLEEAQALPVEALAASKRKAKKRRSIVQTRRPRQRAITKPLAETDLNHDPTLTNSEIVTTKQATSHPVAPKPRGRPGSAILQGLPAQIDDAQIEAQRGLPELAQAPRKRGRPKKSQVSFVQVVPKNVGLVIDEEGVEMASKQRGRPKRTVVPTVKPVLAETTDGVTTHTKGETTPRKRTAKKAIEAVKSVVLDHSPKETDVPNALSKSTATSLFFPAKKRGRPKNQVTQPFPVEASNNAKAYITEEKGPRKRALKKINEPVQPTVSDHLPKESAAPTATSECTDPYLLPLVRKPGRPKKQVIESLAAPTTAKQSATVQQPKIRSKDMAAPPEPSHISGPKLGARPLTASIYQDDDDDDPLSESTPFPPNGEPKASGVKRPSRLANSTTFEPSKQLTASMSDQSDMNEVPSFEVAKRPRKANGQETTTQDENKVLSTSPPLSLSPPYHETTKLNFTDQPL